MASEIFRYWGKADPNYPGDPKWHPLVYHCLDVAAVGAVWLEVSKSLRAAFCMAFDVPVADFNRLRAWLLFFLAQHDLGKFDIRFQLKAPDVLRAIWREFDPAHAETERYDHGCAGLRWAAQECNRWLEYPDESYRVRDAWLPWLEAVTGHHGEWSSATSIVLDAEDYVIQHDREARREFIFRLADLFLKPVGLKLADPPPTCTTAAQHLLAGFCSVCDWIGSNTDVSPYVAFDPETSLDAYLAGCLKAIREKQWLAHFGLVHEVAAYTKLATLLKPDESPRGVQVRVDGLATETGLVLIEAPTGSGKTEAALAYAWRLLSMGCADSIVFALPTQATANAMLTRAEDFAGKAYADAPANVVLAHGKAKFHDGFQQLIDVGRGTTVQGREEASAQCAAWLAQSRKRVFLGQIGVCTVDQVLLSVLPVRHKFVRGFGLNKSVLIVDEVHAYDAYMHGLLAEVLRRQHDTGGPAILLSATLPAGVRNKLLGAWGATSQQVNDYPAIWSAPTRHSGESQNPEGVLAPITVPPEHQPSERTVDIELLRLPDGQPDDALLDRIVIAARSGARVAVILNLVEVAQATVRRLREKTDFPVDIFHARYRFLDRQEKEAAVLDHYGREAKRDGGRILVATQVVEQSLDLDFDWMVTQICPVDLLFQRLGRLHRHEWRKGRPEAFRSPRCTVISVDSQDYGLHKLIYGNARVLWRTDTLLAKHDRIVFPAAYRAWIEQVYAERADEDEPDAIFADYCAWRDMQKQSERDAMAMITTPRLRQFDDGSDAAAITVRTRDGEMSLTVLPQREDGRLLDGTALETLDERQQAETLALNLIPVPHSWKKTFRGNDIRMDEEGRYPLCFRLDGLAHVVSLTGGKLLRYTTDYGLERVNDEPA